MLGLTLFACTKYKRHIFPVHKMQIDYQQQIIEKYYPKTAIRNDTFEKDIIDRIQKLNDCLKASSLLSDLNNHEMFELKRIQQQNLYEQLNGFLSLKMYRQSFGLCEFFLDAYIDEIKRALQLVQEQIAEISFEIYNFEILSDYKNTTVAYYEEKECCNNCDDTIIETETLASTVLDTIGSVASTYVYDNYF